MTSSGRVLCNLRSLSEEQLRGEALTATVRQVHLAVTDVFGWDFGWIFGGFLWIFMDFSEFSWMFVDFYRCLWIFVKISGEKKTKRHQKT